MATEGRPIPAAAASPRATGAGACLRRGMGAGLVAGLASGLFQLVAGEPSVEHAIRLEHAAAGGAAAEVFTREVQRGGLVAATALYGVALGGVVALVVVALARRMRGSAWERALKVALAGFGAFWLVPFLKYPANPPAVGDPATIGIRTGSYLAMAAISVAALVVAVAAARRLAARGVEPHLRHVTAAAGYVAVVACAFVALPGAEPVGLPADLVWDFRLAAAGGQAILWTGIGAGLGALSLRAERRAAGAERRPAAL